jgi:hypothetical protein
MVPMQPNLAPMWNFDQHAHGQHVKVIMEPPTLSSPYATYVPALNKAGWYKFFFLEIAHAPDDIGKLIPALCADTHKPGVLNHPDLNKRDRSEIPALQARAGEIQNTAIKRVCDETRNAMMLDKSHSATATTPAATSAQVTGSTPHSSSDEEALMLLKIQMQANDAAVRSVMDGDIVYKSAGGDAGGYGRLV